jgi:hypothetical protein
MIAVMLEVVSVGKRKKGRLKENNVISQDKATVSAVAVSS